MSIMPKRGVCLYCGHDHDKVPPVFQELAAANERIRELELLLTAQKQEWEKAYAIALAERAVSDRLLDALKETVNRLQFANMRVDCEAEIAAADSVITEIEAMRKEQK